jgi:hypothetical protein
MSIFGNQYDLGFKDGIREGRKQMLDEMLKFHNQTTFQMMGTPPSKPPIVIMKEPGL